MSPNAEQDAINYLLFIRDKKAELKAQIKELTRQKKEAQKKNKKNIEVVKFG